MCGRGSWGFIVWIQLPALPLGWLALGKGCRALGWEGISIEGLGLQQWDLGANVMERGKGAARNSIRGIFESNRLT